MSDTRTASWVGATTETIYADAERQALIERCLAGEETAYVTLYNQHAAMVYRLAYGLLQNQQDAEEVLQDSFEYAFRKLSAFDPRKSAFTTWLYRITVSRCRNKRRRRWLPTFSLNHGPQQDIKDNKLPTPDQALQLTERQAIVWAALAQLSPKLRETAVLRYYHDLRYKEIGAILGIPAKTAESRMRLAHRLLRELLDPEELP